MTLEGSAMSEPIATSIIARAVFLILVVLEVQGVVQALMASARGTCERSC